MSDDTRPVAFVISDSEILNDIPSDLRDTDSAPLRCNHPGCLNPVVRTGKGGRPPKSCDEHRGKRASTTPNGSKSSVSGKSWARAGEIESILKEYVSYLGLGIQLVNPADGKIIADGGPNVVHELVELAKTDSRFRKPLEMLATPGKYGPLVLALMGVLIPLLANHGLMPQFRIPGLTEDKSDAPHLSVV